MEEQSCNFCKHYYIGYKETRRRCYFYPAPIYSPYTKPTDSCNCFQKNPLYVFVDSEAIQNRFEILDL